MVFSVKNSFTYAQWIIVYVNTKKNTIAPSIQMSLLLVNRRKLIDSGAIHFIGSFPLDADNK